MSPVGSVSTTVIVPELAAVPSVLSTVMVYTPLVPTVKVPAWLFVTLRSGVTTVVFTEALLLPAPVRLGSVGSLTPAAE